ncbi:MAG TPA: porin, partial [Acidobacteriota bacterium]|nr:porin [Acidobacteriota bacterium]
GTVFKYFDFKIMPDFGGGTTVLQDAYLDARFHPAFKVRFGKGKTPFGLERLQSATDLMLIERSLATNLVPNRDIGIYAYGDIVPKRVNYAIGVMNGVIDLGSADIDNGQDKDFVARIFAYPIPEFGVGIAVTAGDQFGSLLSPSLPSYRTQGQLVWFRYRAGLTSDLTTLANGQRMRYSPQGTFYKGPVGILAEYVSSSQEVIRLTDSADIRNTAYNITTVFALTGEDESYKGIVPENNFDPSSGKWGGIEVAVRYSRLNIDEDVFPVFADPLTSASSAENFGAGLNWYLNKNVKFMFSYDHTDFETADIKTEQLFMTRFQIAW